MHHHTCNLLPHDQVRLLDTKAKRSPNQLLLNLSPFFSEEDMIQTRWRDKDMQKTLALLAKSRQFGNQRTVTVAGARETVGSPVVQKTGIQCFNCKGFGHYARECRKPKRVKDYAYHKEKMMNVHNKLNKEVSPAKSSDQNATECVDERTVLANLIAEIDTLDTEKTKRVDHLSNPKYLKKAQSDKPRLYEIPYDTSDPANRFCPDGEETVTLEKESRSKLDKDTVKPYNYTYQNSLYETFKPPSKAYLDQLERAKEVRKTMWRKTFVRTKPNIAKNVGFLPMSKSISKSRLLLSRTDKTTQSSVKNKLLSQTWSNHTVVHFLTLSAKRWKF
ncbi:retrovirus-related pol polyprotein from transposon TNT 1-94 [Tanacetum coccineum]